MRTDYWRGFALKFKSILCFFLLVALTAENGESKHLNNIIQVEHIINQLNEIINVEEESIYDTLDRLEGFEKNLKKFKGKRLRIGSIDVIPPNLISCFSSATEDVYPSKESMLKGLEKIDLQNWYPIRQFLKVYENAAKNQRSLREHPNQLLYHQLLNRYYKEISSQDKLKVILGAIHQLRIKYEAILKEKQKLKKSKTKESSNNKQNEKAKLTEEVIGRAMVDGVLQASGPIYQKIFQKLNELEIGKELGLLLDILNTDIEANSALWAKGKLIDELDTSGRGQLFFQIPDKSRISDFIRLSNKVLGGGTIAQTHLIRVILGYESFREYIVKIQRPGIADMVRRESKLIRSIARDTGLSLYAEQLIAGVEKEINFKYERENLTSAKVYNLPQEGIYAVAEPSEFNLESSTVLTMEKAPGRPISHLLNYDGLDSKGEQRLFEAMTDLYRFFVKNALNGNGFFHGDPHGGNIFFHDSSSGSYRLTLIDFGNAAYLDRSNSEALAKFTNAMQKRNVKEVRSAIYQLVNRHGDKPFNKTAKKIIDACVVDRPSPDLKSHVLDFLAEKERQIEIGSDDQEEIKTMIESSRLGCLRWGSSSLKYIFSRSSDLSLTKKTNEVLALLLGSGIPIPHDIIRFNTAKGVLEGMISKVKERVNETNYKGASFNPEDYFLGTLKQSARP